MNIANTSVFLSPQFAVLAERQMQDLHDAALEVLRHTGVRFFHPEALERLKRAGAHLSEDNLVRFPAHLVEAALASAPGRVVMCDRDGEPGMALEGEKVYFGTGSDCLNFLDPQTGEHRKFTRKDLVDGYRLCDALPNIHFVMSIGIPAEVPEDRLYTTQMALMLEHTRKPIVFVAENLESCRGCIDMAAAVAGGLPALREQAHIALYSEPSSPLQQSRDAVDKLLLMAETGLPVVHSPAPLMGGTGPITMASGLALCLAEILSALVVHQLTSPGAPFIFGAGLHHMDMRSAQICYASPEFQLTKAAIAQMGRRYGLPTWGYAGCSDAKVLDEQAALESLLSVLTAKLSGGNLIHDVGYLESGLTTSFEMIVLTDELIALADHFMKGIRVDPQALMLDEIHRVGPGGHYLNTDQTLRHFRDFWYPGLLDRQRRPEWLAEGSLTLGHRLNARVKEILQGNEGPALEADTKRQVEEILARS